MTIGARLGRLKERLLLPYFVRVALERLDRRLDQQDRRLERLQESIGRLEARQTRAARRDAGLPAPGPATPLARLHAQEFRAFSQFGEDGIIAYLVDSLPDLPPVFVEIGVERYVEANTRFLLTDRGWSGVVIDADAGEVARIRRSRIYWLHDLRALASRVTRENVDGLLADCDLAGDIGLLSLDIDGMDYWVWEALTGIRPAIVVVEYNHRFGPHAAVTVPYDPDFDRRRAHHSLTYFGASLRALVELGDRKGYDFVGAGRAGLNAFFVRRDLRPPHLPALAAAEGFVAGGFSEYHDHDGTRRKLPPDGEAQIANALPLVDVSERRDPAEPPA